MDSMFTYTLYVEIYPLLLYFVMGWICMWFDYVRPTWWKPMICGTKIVPVATQITVLPIVIVNTLQYCIFTGILDYNFSHIRDSLISNYTIYNLVFRFGIIVPFILVWTYFIHRGLHHPRIYSYIHKKHHEFQHPFGFESYYMHPVETFLIGYIPHIPGYFLFNIHEAMIIGMYIHILAILTHCGHEWSWSHYVFDNSHDVHHEKFNYNYGFGMPWMDKLMGTYKCRPKRVSFTK
jgi:lathosterol oxidase